jgi:DNA-binding YbaB/EbfC family protein
MLDKMKQLWEMQKKMQELKRELERTTFEISSSDGQVKLVMNGAQQVQSVSFPQGLEGADRAKLENAVKDVFNRAIKRSQEVASQKMKEIGGLNLPGL